MTRSSPSPGVLGSSVEMDWGQAQASPGQDADQWVHGQSGRLTLASNQTSPYPSLGTLSQGRKWKEKRLMGWDNECLTRKATAAKASKARRGIHSFFPIRRWIFRHLLGSKPSACAVVAWEGKCNNCMCPTSFLLLSMSFYCLLQCHMV